MGPLRARSPGFSATSFPASGTRCRCHIHPMAVPLPPASNLHAILLVTKSRSLGPRLVFHYPPLSPSAAALAAAKDPAWFRHDTSTASVDSRSSDSDWDSSGDSDDDNDIEIG